MTQTIVIRAVISISALVVGIFLFTLHRQKGITHISTLAYAICLTAGAIALVVTPLITNPPMVTGFMVPLYLIFGFFPAFVFTYILGHTIQSQRIPNLIFPVLLSVPVILLLIIAIQPVGGILLSGTDPLRTNGTRWDLWGWLILVYSFGVQAASIILSISQAGNTQKPLMAFHLIVLDGAIITNMVLGFLSFTNFIPWVTKFDLMLIGYALIGAALHYTNLKIPQTNLVTREELFDGINDGIIVLNNKDTILELNSAAEQLIGIPSQRAYGNPVESILTNWNSMSNSDDARETEFRGSINLNQQWHHISVRIVKLDDGRGKLIFLRDMTQRKDPDELRQLAREEMFNLLRSFFKTATSFQSSNDFFRDVLFQITYTFHAESGAICLIDLLPNTRNFKFSLMAKHGSIMENKNNITNLQEALVNSKWIMGNKEPLIISKEMDNPEFAKIAPQFGNHLIAIIPLLYNEQLMGVLMLARTGENGFIADEIVRLSVVTEELASFIYSDRKRKSDIALAERHRLAQDLHDSITQKLYGLVTLTEAVKLGLESGTPVDENRMVDKISESARQALREMRLFLFELEPVDIERDGLVSTIQQRLASVEGRSGIQARMLSDNEISLSVEKETEIYYIVEEALNNILKHANAKSVLVKLKQKRESLSLEIVDNGCGFDSDHIKFGGKGLGNIKERAKRINGRLKISSSPEHGTKISLVVPQ